jgi:uncharacterized protein YndB with AHSA1/START domain
MSSRVLVSLRVKAAPDRAFRVFTEEIGAWWRHNPLFQFTPAAVNKGRGRLAFEPGEGGRFTETLPNGKVFEIGRITAWEPGRRLAFTWRQITFKPGQGTEVEVRFDPVGEETRVTVEHCGWDSVPLGHVARHGMQDPYFQRRVGEWWQELLAGLGGWLQATKGLAGSMRGANAEDYRDRRDRT